jgi:hypothetical protein
MMSPKVRKTSDKICLAAAQQQIHSCKNNISRNNQPKRTIQKQTKIIGKLLMHLTLINKNNRSDIVVDGCSWKQSVVVYCCLLIVCLPHAIRYRSSMFAC